MKNFCDKKTKIFSSINPSMGVIKFNDINNKFIKEILEISKKIIDIKQEVIKL